MAFQHQPGYRTTSSNHSHDNFNPNLISSYGPPASVSASGSAFTASASTSFPPPAPAPTPAAPPFPPGPVVRPSPSPSPTQSYGQQNAGHFSHPQHLPHYPNPHSQPVTPASAYLQSPAHGQINSSIGPRQPYQPSHAPGSGNNATGPLTAPPTMLPDDPFKKPFPPQKTDLPRQVHQQYLQHAQTSPDHHMHDQQQAVSAASSTPTTAAFPPQRPSKQLQTTGSSNPATSSMTSSAPPVTSTQSTPTSENPTQPTTDAAPQASKLSPQDQERVDALLSVNNLLLQEVQVLQKAGLKTPQSSGNPQSPQQAGQASGPSSQTKPEGTTASPTSTDPSATAAANPSAASTNSTPTTTTPVAANPQQPSQNQKKFVELMRRLQSNIMFLVSISDTSKQKQKLPYPSHLEALPNWLADGMKEEDKPQLEALKQGYKKLRELWPDWKPAQQHAQIQQQNQSQQSQQQLQNRS